MTTVIDPKSKDYVPERYDAFRHWRDAQGIPVVTGFFIEDVNTVELGQWDLKGAPAAFVILEGTGGANDAYICEIPPGQRLKPQKHLYEEMVYVTQGHGATSVWQRDGDKHTFEWGPGSLFAMPLNASYQHFNTSGSQPARYFAVTNSCFIINMFHNLDFVSDNDFAFTDRFGTDAKDYFNGDSELYGRFFMSTNFVPDTRTIGLADYSERGKGSTSMKFDLAGNTMGAHISEFPVGTYKKCHRHGPGAHVIILSGQGYSILWPEGEELRRVDWKPGSVVVPPDQWFHQHFNSGSIAARYLALRWNSWRFKSIMKSRDGATHTSIKEGGGQIEFEDEDPAFHRDFEAALEKVDVRCRMGAYHPFCTEK